MTILFEVGIAFPRKVRGTADPSASPDFLSRVAASVNCMWFSLGRTTSVVAIESGEVGNPSTLGMTKRKGQPFIRSGCRTEVFFVILDGPAAHRVDEKCLGPTTSLY